LTPGFVFYFQARLQSEQQQQSGLLRRPKSGIETRPRRPGRFRRPVVEDRGQVLSSELPGGLADADDRNRKIGAVVFHPPRNFELLSFPLAAETDTEVFRIHRKRTRPEAGSKRVRAQDERVRIPDEGVSESPVRRPQRNSAGAERSESELR